jgi:hypothetical protein
VGWSGVNAETRTLADQALRGHSIRSPVRMFRISYVTSGCPVFDGNVAQFVFAFRERSPKGSTLPGLPLHRLLVRQNTNDPICFHKRDTIRGNGGVYVAQLRGGRPRPSTERVGWVPRERAARSHAARDLSCSCCARFPARSALRRTSTCPIASVGAENHERSARASRGFAHHPPFRSALPNKGRP